MKTLVLVNVLNSVNSYVYSNHIEFWSKTKELYPKSHNNEFILFSPPRMSIDMARNNAAKIAMQLECDYLMFIDDDVLIPPTTFDSLLKCNTDIASGLVMIRSYPFEVMAFKKVEGSYVKFNDLPMIEVSYDESNKELKKFVLKDPVTQDDGLEAVGFSCALIKVGLLKKLDPPFFVTGPYNTEDIYFCWKVKDCLKENFKISLATHVQCEHLLDPEPVSWPTAEVFKEFYETLRPEFAERIRKDIAKDESDLRGIDYIKKHLKKLE